jgi:HEAT repeat protein
METVILQALGRIGDPSAQLVLLEALADKDEQRRRAAALALGDLGDRSAVKPLITALQEESDVQTRGFAAISLGRLGGDAARDALREAFSVKGSRTVKTFAALGLGLLGDRAFSPEILKALQQPSEESMRGAYAVALGLLNEPRALETLFKIVESRGSHHRLRGYAAVAIALIRPEGGYERLVKIYEEDTDKVDMFRRLIAVAVGLYGNPKAGPALTKSIVSDSRDLVREHASLGLNMCRPRSEIETLSKILEKEQYKGDLALFCVVALAGLGDRFEYPVISESFFNFNYRVHNSFVEDLMYVL